MLRAPGWEGFRSYAEALEPDPQEPTHRNPSRPAKLRTSDQLARANLQGYRRPKRRRFRCSPIRFAVGRRRRARRQRLRCGGLQEGPNPRCVNVRRETARDSDRRDDDQTGQEHPTDTLHALPAPLPRKARIAGPSRNRAVEGGSRCGATRCENQVVLGSAAGSIRPGLDGGQWLFDVTDLASLLGRGRRWARSTLDGTLERLLRGGRRRCVRRGQAGASGPTPFSASSAARRARPYLSPCVEQ